MSTSSTLLVAPPSAPDRLVLKPRAITTTSLPPASGAANGEVMDSETEPVDAISPHPRDVRFADLLENNRRWAARVARERPGFFETLAKQQNPELLWIGCSDSRVPANQLLKLLPGEVFVHRNIANCVNHTDLNVLSVLQYSVDVLKVKHIIVCGHYGCGGVAAALSNQQFGLIDNWLRGIKDVYDVHKRQLDKYPDHQSKLAHLAELNVARSVENVCHTTIVQNAWARGQPVSVHGWCYQIMTGLIKDLEMCVSKPDQIRDIYNVVTSEKNSL